MLQESHASSFLGIQDSRDPISVNLRSHLYLVIAKVSFMTSPAFTLIKKPTVSRGKFPVKGKMN